MRSGRRKSPHLRRIVQNYLAPIFLKLSGILREGKERGDFREVDVRGFVIRMAGSIQHYFNAIPFAIASGTSDPLQPKAIAAQRAVALDYISHALLRQDQ